MIDDFLRGPDKIGPVPPRDPETERKAALVIADRLGRDCLDVLRMLGLAGEA